MPTAVAYLHGLNKSSTITEAEEILLNLNGDNKEEEETSEIAAVLDLNGDNQTLLFSEEEVVMMVRVTVIFTVHYHDCQTKTVSTINHYWVQVHF